MEDLMDLIADDQSPSEISDKIKEILYAKTSEKIDDYRPHVYNSVLNMETEE
jgi:hypothetical protein